MSTIHNLRAWQSGTIQTRLFDTDDAVADSGTTDRRPPKQGSAEIILFPKASLKALKRPRKKLQRRGALRT